MVAAKRCLIGRLVTGAGVLAALMLAGCGSEHPVEPPPPRGEAQAAEVQQVRAEKIAVREVGEIFVPQPNARRAAAEALARLGEPGIPALIDALSDPNADVRRYAADGLAVIGPSAQTAVGSLIRLLEDDPDEAVRESAARALGQIGPAAAEAVPALHRALRSNQ